jgi:DNA-directed RNA polymerase beta' subunit
LSLEECVYLAPVSEQYLLNGVNYKEVKNPEVLCSRKKGKKNQYCDSGLADPAIFGTELDAFNRIKLRNVDRSSFDNKNEKERHFLSSILVGCFDGGAYYRLSCPVVNPLYYDIIAKIIGTETENVKNVAHYKGFLVFKESDGSVTKVSGAEAILKLLSCRDIYQCSNDPEISAIFKSFQHESLYPDDMVMNVLFIPQLEYRFSFSQDGTRLRMKENKLNMAYANVIQNSKNMENLLNQIKETEDLKDYDLVDILPYFIVGEQLQTAVDLLYTGQGNFSIINEDNIVEPSCLTDIFTDYFHDYYHNFLEDSMTLDLQ